MYVLVFNPGGNSLKAEIVQVEPGQTHAFEGKYLASVSVEGISKKPELLRYKGKEVITREPIAAADYKKATQALLDWFGRTSGLPGLNQLACAGLRVVHGGGEFVEPAKMTDAVVEKIRSLENLAPLHNRNSLEVLGPARERLGNIPVYGVFDTAFPRDANCAPSASKSIDRGFPFHRHAHR